MTKIILFALSLCVSIATLAQQDMFNNVSQFGMGSSLADAGEYVTYDNEGNILVYGFFGSAMDFDPTAQTSNVSPLGKPDLFVAKYNPAGNLLWVLNLGRISLNNGMDAGGIAIDSNNDILIAGSYTNTVNFNPLGTALTKPSVGGKDAFLAKYTSNGYLVWVKTYGSSLFDSGTQLALDESDNIYFGVRFYGDIDVGDSGNSVVVSPQSGASDAALVKYDANGTYIWSYSVSSAGNDDITAIEIASNGMIALGARVNGEISGIAKRNMKMILLNADGTLNWDYNFNNFAQGNEISTFLFSEDNTALYVAGRIQGETEFDPSGSGSTIIQPLFADPFFAKYNTSNGSLIYAKRIESAGTEDYVSGITTAGSALILIGSFDFQAIFIPGDFSTQINSKGDMDIYMAAYDKMTGEYIHAKTFGGAGTEFARHAQFKPNGNVLVTGSFSGSLDIHPQDGPITSAGLSDMFFAEFSFQINVSDGLKQKFSSDEITLFPVPANDFIGIRFSTQPVKPVKVKIMNIVGTTVAEFSYDNYSPNSRIDIAGFNSGVYIMEIITDGTRVSKRFIKN